jgi:hypothetical protein
VGRGDRGTEGEDWAGQFFFGHGGKKPSRTATMKWTSATTAEALSWPLSPRRFRGTEYRYRSTPSTPSDQIKKNLEGGSTMINWVPDSPFLDVTYVDGPIFIFDEDYELPPKQLDFSERASRIEEYAKERANRLAGDIGTKTEAAAEMSSRDIQGMAAPGIEDGTSNTIKDDFWPQRISAIQMFDFSKEENVEDFKTKMEENMQKHDFHFLEAIEMIMKCRTNDKFQRITQDLISALIQSSKLTSGQKESLKTLASQDLTKIEIQRRDLRVYRRPGTGRVTTKRDFNISLPIISTQTTPT